MRKSFYQLLEAINQNKKHLNQKINYDKEEVLTPEDIKNTLNPIINNVYNNLNNLNINREAAIIIGFNVISGGLRYISNRDLASYCNSIYNYMDNYVKNYNNEEENFNRKHTRNNLEFYSNNILLNIDNMYHFDNFKDYFACLGYIHCEKIIDSDNYNYELAKCICYLSEALYFLNINNYPSEAVENKINEYLQYANLFSHSYELEEDDDIKNINKLKDMKMPSSEDDWFYFFMFITEEVFHKSLLDIGILTVDGNQRVRLNLDYNDEIVRKLLNIRSNDRIEDLSAKNENDFINKLIKGYSYNYWGKAREYIFITLKNKIL